MTKTWRGSMGDKLALATSKRHARVRSAKRSEPAGQVLSLRTCKGVMNASVIPLPTHHRHEMIADAMSRDWRRPFPETNDAIGAALAMDDGTLSELATALITIKTLCKRPECNCGAGYAPVIAGLVQNAPDPNAAFADHVAVHGPAPSEVMTSPKVKAMAARTRLLQDIRADLHKEAAR